MKVAESRVIAGVLLSIRCEEDWHNALYQDNVLQARSLETAKRLARLLRLRLQTMDTELWRLIRDGSLIVSTHACLAAAIKHSVLVGDFLDLVIREQYRVFSPTLSRALWERYIEDCGAREPEMPQWRESTVQRLRSSVFQILAQGAT